MDRIFLKDKAYQELRGLLLDGTFLPGEFLSERKLGEQLGMSKTPIRAALERLEMEGFVRTSPQQGIVVRELSLREICEHYEIRAALEGYTVQQIAGRLTPEQAARVEATLHTQEVCMDANDIPGHVAADAAFHLLLADFLGNQEILRVMQHQRDKIFRVTLHISQQHPDRMAHSLAEHRRIFAAVRDGQAEEAATCMREHLEAGKQYLLH